MSAGAMPLQENTVANVRHGIDLLMSVIKKHAFYPEGNATLEESLQTFHTWLDGYLREHGGLRIDVEKNRFLHDGEVVQQEKSGERSMIFPLFRDGVQWFEFVAGVTVDEVLGFVRLANRYRDLREESENDLVTALWEADFSCIRHKAVDKFWEAETLVSISGFKAAAPAPASGGGSVADDGEPDAEVGFGWAGQPPAGAGREAQARSQSARMFTAKLEFAQSAATNPLGADGGETIGLLWKLTAEEEAVLARMIAAEESRDAGRDCLGVILALVGEELDESDRTVVREFAVEGVRQLMERGDFTDVRAFVERLAVMRDAGRAAGVRLIDAIAAEIAGPGVFGALDRMLPQLHAVPDAALDDLRRVLLLLPAAVTAQLATLAPRTGDPRARTIFMDAIAHHAARSRADISPVVGAMPPAFIRELIDGYAVRGQPPPVVLLTKLTRHRDASVREAAARALLADNPNNIKAVSHLLDDPVRSIGRWLLGEMGKSRNPIAEKLLLDYIDGELEAGEDEDEKFLFECYCALGRCGLKSSVGYLRDILMRKSLGAFLGIERTVHRTGAAAALSLMPPEWGAREALRDAKNSRLPGIRRAHTRALRNTRRRERGADDG